MRMKERFEALRQRQHMAASSPHSTEGAIERAQADALVDLAAAVDESEGMGSAIAGMAAEIERLHARVAELEGKVQILGDIAHGHEQPEPPPGPPPIPPAVEPEPAS